MARAVERGRRARRKGRTPVTPVVDWGALRGRLVDLSLPVDERAPAYPGDPAPRLAPWATLARDGYRVTHLHLGSHQGTHLDAPSHFLEGGDDADAIPLATCVGPALCVHLGGKAPGDDIGVADIEPVACALTPGARLVLRTGWDRSWPAPEYFTDGPRLTEDLAAWLAARRLALLGLDLPTPHPWADVDGRIHRRLLSAGTVLLEGLAHLERVPQGSFWLSALPLRLGGADASPVRAIGLVPEPAAETRAESAAAGGATP